ncbi:uncharacterized protein LOC117330013 [Pecten maximus]|uniref:uncharacterized protein LOC117330013 n=1 Tax=Pecten maximus TaxID=6579 RepID=UPI001458F4D2|nr:uncharacterized protein LOC117330013 [Pecten maximus]
MINVFILFCALTAGCYAAVDKTTPSHFQCDLDSECNPTQCCSKIPRFLVVSKKRQLSPPISMFVSASCKPYIQLNESCIYVMKINGDCGCAPDLVCKYFPELDAFNPINIKLPTPPAMLQTLAPSKRMMINASPESYKCVPKTT